MPSDITDSVPDIWYNHLVLCPARDKVIFIPDGSHCLFYDKSVEAEEMAVKAVCDYASGLL